MTATHCNTLQHTATHRITLQHPATQPEAIVTGLSIHLSQDTYMNDCNTLQHTATHCNTLQHTATHRITLQHPQPEAIVTGLSIQINANDGNYCPSLVDVFAGDSVADLKKVRGLLQCVAVCCGVLQRVAACCSVLQRVAACCSVLQRVAACCSATIVHPSSTSLQETPWRTSKRYAACCSVL